MRGKQTRELSRQSKPPCLVCVTHVRELHLTLMEWPNTNLTRAETFRKLQTCELIYSWWEVYRGLLITRLAHVGVWFPDMPHLVQVDGEMLLLHDGVRSNCSLYKYKLWIWSRADCCRYNSLSINTGLSNGVFRRGLPTQRKVFSPVPPYVITTPMKTAPLKYISTT